MAIEGFWSYVHADDDAEGGRITQLSHDVVTQYELLTGESISLFLDRTDLLWGDKWKSKVDDLLASVAFFIPVLTPRYFMSTECRRELNTFIREAVQLGLQDLLMPILYVDVPGLQGDDPADELMALVKPFQWEPWTELRFSETTSGEYRRAVSKLAERLVQANVSTEHVTPPSDPAVPVEPDDDDEPGTLDRLLGAAEGMEGWSETLSQIGEQITSVNVIVQSGTDEMERYSGNKTFAVNIRVLRRVALELGAPVAEIVSLSQKYTQYLYDIDLGIRIAIEQAADEVARSEIPLVDAQAFFTIIRDLAASVEEGLGQTQVMVDSIGGVAKLSRDIRPVLRTLKKALTVLVEGREVTRGWVLMMDASPQSSIGGLK